ncbi:hypothetical protein Tco_1287070, partial [Tanacetum coccineum]
VIHIVEKRRLEGAELFTTETFEFTLKGTVSYSFESEHEIKVYFVSVESDCVK